MSPIIIKHKCSWILWFLLKKIKTYIYFLNVKSYICVFIIQKRNIWFLILPKRKVDNQMPYDGNIIYDSSFELFLRINSSAIWGSMQLRLIFEFHCEGFSDAKIRSNSIDDGCVQKDTGLFCRKTVLKIYIIFMSLIYISHQKLCSSFNP